MRSRRELVGKVFFGHYEPRLRGNERRLIEGEPVRGRPYPSDEDRARRQRRAAAAGSQEAAAKPVREI